MKDRIKKFFTGDRRKTLPIAILFTTVLFLIVAGSMSLYNYKVREVYGVSTRKFKTLDELEKIDLEFEIYTIYDVYYNIDRESYSNGYFYYRIRVNDVEMDIENLRYEVMFDCDSFKDCKSEVSYAAHNEVDPYDTAASFIYFGDSFRWSKEISQTNRMRSCEKECEDIERYTYYNFERLDILPVMYIRMEYDYITGRGTQIEYAEGRTEYIKVTPEEYIVEETNFY